MGARMDELTKQLGNVMVAVEQLAAKVGKAADASVEGDEPRQEEAMREVSWEESIQERMAAHTAAHEFKSIVIVAIICSDSNFETLNSLLNPLPARRLQWVPPRPPALPPPLPGGGLGCCCVAGVIGGIPKSILSCAIAS